MRRADVLGLATLLAAGCVPGSRGTSTASAARDTTAAPRRAGAASAAGFDRPLSAESGAAFLHYDPAERAWTLGNRRFEERLELRPLPESGGRVHLVRRALFSRDRAINADVAPLDEPLEGVAATSSVTVDALGVDVDGQLPDLTPLDQQLEVQPDGVLYATIRFRDDAHDAELIAEVRLRPGHAVVEHRTSVRHDGQRPLRLTRLDAAHFTIRSGLDARWRAGMLDNAGNTSFVRLGREGVLEAETPAQSAARAPVIPLLVLHDATGDEGLFFALRWSTNYLLKVRSLGDRRVSVEAGVRMLADPAIDPPSAVDASPGFGVRPGQTITGPWLVVGLFDGGIEEATHALQAYLMEDRPREPTWASRVLPVAWNSWFAYGTGVDYRSMLAEAREASRLGVEVVYVDYGWSAAQGDWTPHPRRFPGRTFQQLAQEVHRLGMRFGLWVAFGVAEEGSQLLRRHPDFRARQPAPVRTGIDGSWPLCLSRAQSHLQGELARIVRDYRVDWLKFDQPMVAACLDDSHGHDPTVRGSLQANNQAFYDLLRGLRQQFPELFVESTFDGAGYLDYGVFARSHAAWLDDAAGDPTVPMATVQQSFYGATLAFPARFLTSWLARGPVGDGVEGRSLDPDDLRYQGYSTMGGSWGLSLRLGDLDSAQRAAVQALIQDYHTFRELIPGAQVYHLQPPLTVAPSATQGPMVRDWFALQYLQPELGRGAVLVVRNGGGPQRLVLRLRGLGPQTPYRLMWSNGITLAEEIGQTVMQRGIAVDLPPYTGGLLWIIPIA